MDKILTIDDLLKFCEEGSLVKFDAEETGYKICVQIPSVYEDLSDRNTDTMLYGKIKILHTGRNRNASNVTYDAAEKCKNNLAYKPILGNFCEIEGIQDFTSHDRIVLEDGTIEYQEKQIGCITNDEAYLEYDEEKDDYIIPEGWFEHTKFNEDEQYNNPIYERVIGWKYLEISNKERTYKDESVEN